MKEILFHKLEIGVCGFSGSGKTTLIESILRKMSNKYTIGYVKHDAHQFEIDQKLKDTDRAFHAGANGVYINSQTKKAFYQLSPSTIYDQNIFLDFDFVMVEGYKNSSMPKIVMIDNDKSIFDGEQKLENILCYVGAEDDFDFGDTPYYKRDNIDNIISLIENKLISLNEKSIYGLVLMGGKSSRMGHDKSKINYHGKPQALIAYELLSSFCEKTFLSVANNENLSKELEHCETIADKISGIGPMGGIISSQMEHPNKAWLVLACDLPFVSKENIQYLINERDPFKIATAFLNPEKNWPEPLITIYEPKSQMRLLQHLSVGLSCPRKALMNSQINSLDLQNKSHKFLKNINTPDQKTKVLNEINSK